MWNHTPHCGYPVTSHLSQVGTPSHLTHEAVFTILVHCRNSQLGTLDHKCMWIALTPAASGRSSEHHPSPQRDPRSAWGRRQAVSRLRTQRQYVRAGICHGLSHAYRTEDGADNATCSFVLPLRSRGRRPQGLVLDNRERPMSDSRRGRKVRWRETWTKVFTKTHISMLHRLRNIT